MQALFFIDNRACDPTEGVNLYCQCCPPPKRAFDYFQELVNGVCRVRSQLDGIIERFSSNWKVSRMSGVDRNVLRLAVFEMLCMDQIPPKVAINEAIDIGKRYGAEESGAFINGILDSIFIASQANDPAVVVDMTAEPEDACSDERDAPTDESVIRPGASYSPVKGKSGVVRRSGAVSSSPKPDSDSEPE